MPAFKIHITKQIVLTKLLVKQPNNDCLHYLFRLGQQLGKKESVSASVSQPVFVASRNCMLQKNKILQFYPNSH